MALSNLAIYRRITNPYMPQGTPDKTNAASLYAPGELGCAFVDENTGGAYLRVQADSGATSATGVGAIAQGQLAFWKDQSSGLVTNDKRFCDVGGSGAINRVAGVFQLSVTAGYYCDLIIKKLNAPLAAGSALIGAQITADTTASTARGVYTTGVNTAPVSQTLGVWNSSNTSAYASGVGLADIAVGFAE